MVSSLQMEMEAAARPEPTVVAAISSGNGKYDDHLDRFMLEILDKVRSTNAVRTELPENCLSSAAALEAAKQVHLSVSLFRQLEKEMGNVGARDFFRRLAKAMTLESAERWRHAHKLANNFEEFKAGVRDWFLCEHRDLFSTTVLEDSPGRLHIRVHKCVWYELYSRDDATEAGYIHRCYRDSILMEELYPRAKMIRQRTLMNGDDCCDMAFVPKQSGSGHRETV